MNGQRWTLAGLILFGLALLGAVARLQGGGSETGTDPTTLALLVGGFLLGLVILFVAAVALLSNLFPPGEPPRAGDRLCLGVLSLFPLAVGVVNAVVGRVEPVHPAFILLSLLNAAAACTAFWLLYYDFNHLYHLNSRVRTAGGKSLWSAALLLGNLVILPVYWYAYVGRSGEGTGGEQSDTGPSLDAGG